MIVKLAGASEAQIQTVCDRITQEPGLTPHIERGVALTVIAVIGNVNGRCQILLDQLQSMPGVTEVQRIGKPYQLAALKDDRLRTVVDVGNGVRIGNGEPLAIVAGPCSIESEVQLRTIAQAVRAAGGTILRGGAYKPRTAPRCFEGLGEDGLKMLRDIGVELDMPTQTEVMRPDLVELVAEHASILQVGARNMQNFDLLKAVGDVRKPVVLKRGLAATIDDLLCAAEHILDRGNPNVILCERGIKTFEDHTRNTATIASIPAIHGLSHLPVMFDPSHGVGKRQWIPDVAIAGVAAGADSLHLEVHHQPEKALSDGPQSLLPDQFALLVQQMRIIEEARNQCLALHM